MSDTPGSSQTNDVIEQESKTIGVVSMDKMPLMKEYQPIFAALRQNYMTAKDIHMLYFDDKSRSFSKGQKTIYRYIHKLVEEGLIIEVGYRETDGSRVTEALYGPIAKVIFYEGPEVMEEWKTEEGQMQLKLIHLLVKKQLGKDIGFDEFEEFAMNYLEKQDTISSELLKIGEAPEIVELFQNIPTKRIGHIIFLATNMAIMAKAYDEF